MFVNIGNKIKTLARIICWIGIVVSVISGIVMLATSANLIPAGILTLVLGSLLSWVGSFILYGFGEMVENSDIRTELAVKEAMTKESAK